MSLFSQLKARAQCDKSVRVGLIGAGKFGSMFLSQALRTPGIQLVGVADLSPDRAKNALTRVGWEKENYSATSMQEAALKKSVFVTDDSDSMIASDFVDIIIDATGSPPAGIHHALLCCRYKKHIVMVNVEADVLAGPLLARRAAEAGIIYSMAAGDQPSLIAEMVDWARTIGFEVVCAGKGTKYLPSYHRSTPDTVWGHYGFSPEQVSSGDFNAQMFNSFLDGTKSALEMAAVANSCDLTPSPEGLAFPPCGVDDLPSIMRPVSDGGLLTHKGCVEVVSSLERDGRPVFRDLRWGVYVVIEAPNDYVRDCFSQYGLKTDSSGRYAAMYKPYHLIGLELGFSIASIAIRGEATGATENFSADVVATAKRNLVIGDRLDGEGGYTVYGKLVPARTSLQIGALPIGIAHNLRLIKNVSEGDVVKWSDVEINDSNEAVSFRLEMESIFRQEFGIRNPAL